jgi:U4/U6 small nuclear ribonucleoprotein PRP3
MKLMLTQKERKRLRRQRRSERFQDERDLVEAGLAPKPEPKVKVSNMMRVLGEQAVMDPSAIERKVRAAMAAREANHNARNAARKLTPAERRAKHVAKMTEDVAGTGGIHAAVFVVRDLTDRRQRYKVDINARQLHLRGVVLLCAPEELNMVLVEGGLRAIGKYRKLLMRRIDWNRVITPEEEAASAAARAVKAAARAAAAAEGGGEEDTEEGAYNDWQEEEEEEEGDSDDEGGGAAQAGHNQCAFVWEGVESRPRFNQFRFEECYTADGARRLLARFGCAAYWDSALAAAPWRAAGAQLALPPASHGVAPVLPLSSTGNAAASS